MIIHFIGLNHTTAPVSLRERLVLDDSAACYALARSAHG